MAIAEASFPDLSERLAANAELPLRPSASAPKQAGELFVALPMNRFRPNLVVSGSDAFAEDDWATVRIGDGVFRSTKPCERCAITTVEQSRGEFDVKEPLKNLASYRMAKDVMQEC